jgi:hypothetical protein
MSTEILIINSLELASELAHQKLINEWSESIKIYVDEEAEELNYSNEAQDIFNGFYDDYLTLIVKCKVKSNEASKVLQLMDNDFTYQEALAKTLKEHESLCKQELEEELNKYI